MVGTSRSSQSGSHQRLWDEEYVIQLEAWLDYCLLWGIDFKSSIISHLEAQTHRTFTLQQVHRRLTLEWNHLGHADSDSVDDLYRQGTACLAYLTDSERAVIERAVNDLGPPKTESLLKDTSSTLRSNLGSVPIDHQSSHDSTQPNVPVVATTSTAEDRLSDTSSDLSDYDERYLQEDFLKPQSIRGNSMPFEPRKVGTEVSRTSSPLFLQVQLTEPTEAQNVGFPEVKTEVSTTDRFLSTRASPTSVGNPEPEIATIEQELSKVKEKLRASESKVNTLQNQVFDMTDRLYRAQIEMEELQHRNRAAVDHRDDAGWPVILQEENTALRKHVLAMQASREDIKKFECNGLGPSDTNVEKQLSDLCSNIRDACNSFGPDEVVVDEPLRETEFDPMSFIVSNWAETASGHDLSRLLRQSSELGVYRSDVLRSLVAAGICKLVFESPVSHLSITESPILRHYRKQLLSRGKFSQLTVTLDLADKEDFRWS
ncbi:hypothetical protein PFICI_11169 [Pestalotiopsis fici W106-1]|uniref:Uncharacterized protein n=1 Tax=Pestalotiopsis fici (strain W106-1 / CGMCC3.15140) TaxID=1229662 RepID=W3WTW3_PESFW|nr:uncharacterized protein PFICI_11169 [Pestalotiopsis fici W106-1]ETS77295.1 hypothetical protein PFICI_11169 [Pestalotiopsis fici W106-1]